MGGLSDKCIAQCRVVVSARKWVGAVMVTDVCTGRNIGRARKVWMDKVMCLQRFDITGAPKPGKGPSEGTALGFVLVCSGFQNKVAQAAGFNSRHLFSCGSGS